MRTNQPQKFVYGVLKLLATGVVIYFTLSSPAGARRLLKGVRKEWRNRKVYQALDRLRGRKLISYRFKKNTIEIELTDAGRRKILQYEAEDIKPLKNKKWDGKWRIILSDIPERHKKGRDALRYKFYEWGFYPLQKSVFIYPFPCEDEIAVIRDLFHIPTKSLLVVETNRIGNELQIKKFFNLR